MKYSPLTKDNIKVGLRIHNPTYGEGTIIDLGYKKTDFRVLFDNKTEPMLCFYHPHWSIIEIENNIPRPLTKDNIKVGQRVHNKTHGSGIVVVIDGNDFKVKFDGNQFSTKCGHHPYWAIIKDVPRSAFANDNPLVHYSNEPGADIYFIESCKFCKHNNKSGVHVCGNCYEIINRDCE